MWYSNFTTHCTASCVRIFVSVGGPQRYKELTKHVWRCLSTLGVNKQDVWLAEPNDNPICYLVLNDFWSCAGQTENNGRTFEGKIDNECMFYVDNISAKIFACVCG